MPVACPDPPSQQIGRRKATVGVSRNDSLRSERSDKRVSFNNDVGIKHIPRGQKEQQPAHPVVKLSKDEWSDCAPVRREKPSLSSQELEQQAEDLVRLLDQVDCVSASKPIRNPSTPSRSLDRVNNKIKNKINNTKLLNNTEKKNNLVNGIERTSRSNIRSFVDARTKNPIGKNILKDNNVHLNRHRQSNNLNNANVARQERRAISATQSSTDINDSDIDSRSGKLGSVYKSVPDIPTGLYYDNNTKNNKKYMHLKDHTEKDNKYFMSVDNLYDNRGRKVEPIKSYKKNRNEFQSADNLTDISIPGNRKLHEYKPYENLQSGFSSTTDIKTNDSDIFPPPQLGSMIKRLNSDPNDQQHQVRHHQIYIENDDDSRAYTKPSSFTSHNNNQPFSYTSAPLSSVEAVRRLSPSRDIHINKDDLYSQVNKPGRNRITRSTSREFDRSSRNNTDSDYSAKIIITGDNVHSRYDDDDHAYETYQVGESNISKHMRDYGLSDNDYLDDYRNHSNSNFNMSSIGCQTEGLPKIPVRSKRNGKSMSPVRTDGHNGYGDDLPSASLVRRINHGFGQFDRSPSPPPINSPNKRSYHRSVVPLLSDTDDSEFDYQRRLDPLAKIRNQVMIREKLQEEREAEEREEREDKLLFNRQHRSLHSLNSSEMQPLTVDEVDALTLEVDKRGRNTLVVAQENSSSTAREKKEFHHRSQNVKSETNVTSRVHSAPPPRGRRMSPDEAEIKNNTKAQWGKDRSLSPKPKLFSNTLEKLKKNTIDKTKGTLEKNKNKEKKKKKIKIKFFYDPRLQDKPNEDPLERFTEYKGASSDDQVSPQTRRRSQEERPPYDEFYNDPKNDFRSLPRNSYLAKDQRTTTRKTERNETTTRTSTSPSRPPRIHSIDRLRDPKYERAASPRSRGRDSSSERVIGRDVRDSKNNKVKALGGNRIDFETSKDFNKTNRTKFRNDYGSNKHISELDHQSGTEEQAMDFHSIRNKFDTVRTDEYEHRVKSRETFRKNVKDETDTDHSSDQGPSLSEKYKKMTNQNSSPIREEKKVTLEDDEKKEKILRQRKKFFGVLLGEGRAKSPPPPSPATATPAVKASTLQRTPAKEASSGTLQKTIQKNEKALIIDTTKEKTKEKKLKVKKVPKPKRKRNRPWPWSLLGQRGPPPQRKSEKKGGREYGKSSRPSSRASSRASSARRPVVRSSKIRRDGHEPRSYITRDKEADVRETEQWESATLSRVRGKPRESSPAPRSYNPPIPRTKRDNNKYSADSSPSSTGTPVGARVGRTTSFKQRYFGDTDTETRRPILIKSTVTGGGDYRSLPNRKPRTHGAKQNIINRRTGGGIRKPSPGARGSAGSSLQSSESEADSHGGSHASRASHVSTGSNRSVYLHATAVADIPVRRGSEEAPSERGLSVQSKKVSRSFSLLAPWKPRHYREKYEVEYDNREVREARESKAAPKSALPPRPPRKSLEDIEAKKVGRSQTVYKDSKLAGWLRRKRTKEAKGI